MKIRIIKKQKRTQKEFKQLVHHFIKKYEKILNEKPNRVTIRDIKTRWGSCTNKRNITINKQLQNMPEDIIELTVCHEMLHLKIFNHSNQFWEELKKYIPNYKELDEKLTLLDEIYLQGKH